MSKLSVLQDADGDFSSKRLVLLILITLFSLASLAQLIGYNLAQHVIDNVTDLIKWVCGFVAAEQTRYFSKSPPQDKEPFENV